MAISASVELFFEKANVHENPHFMILRKRRASKMSYIVEENSPFRTVSCCVILNCYGCNRNLSFGSGLLFGVFLVLCSRKIYICQYYCLFSQYNFPGPFFPVKNSYTASFPRKKELKNNRIMDISNNFFFRLLSA